MRTVLSAMESRLKCKVDAKEKLVVFMADYVAYVQCRLEVGQGGKTAYERMKGKKGTVLGVDSERS